jgi:hypothetical protein
MRNVQLTKNIRNAKLPPHFGPSSSPLNVMEEKMKLIRPLFVSLLFACLMLSATGASADITYDFSASFDLASFAEDMNFAYTTPDFITGSATLSSSDWTSCTWSTGFAGSTNLGCTQVTLSNNATNDQVCVISQDTSQTECFSFAVGALITDGSFVGTNAPNRVPPQATLVVSGTAVAPTPEPGGFVLLASSLLSIAGFRKRRLR